jgi:hypothetical protein
VSSTRIGGEHYDDGDDGATHQLKVPSTLNVRKQALPRPSAPCGRFTDRQRQKVVQAVWKRKT